MSPPPIGAHQKVLGYLYRLIFDFARRFDFGDVVFAPHAVILSPHDIVEPDLVFVATDRGRISSERNYFEGAPTLVVEVISPSSRKRDRGDKQSLYARSGVGEYWIVDPGRRTFEIHVLQGEEYIPTAPDPDGLLPSGVLPGLRVSPSEVFADPD